MWDNLFLFIFFKCLLGNDERKNSCLASLENKKEFIWFYNGNKEKGNIFGFIPNDSQKQKITAIS